MIKLIFAGLWVCAVTIASSYAAVSWKAARAQEAETEAGQPGAGLEQVRTKMISVPIISGGAIQGYVIAQFSFTIESKLLKRLSIKPDAILLDEAFKTIYADEAIDFRNIKKQDLTALVKTIGDNVNKRFGGRFVENVLIQELNYVAKAEARMGVR